MLAFLCCALALAADIDAHARFLTQDQAELILESVEVRAEVAGGLALVDLHQRFANPFDQPVDATWLFPLPPRATVRELEIRCGERRILGELQATPPARRTYRSQDFEGLSGVLLDWESQGFLVQHVVDLCPGEAVEVHLAYAQELPARGGRRELAIPTAGAGGLQLSAPLTDGVPLGDVASDSHRIAVAEGAGTAWTVGLAPGQRAQDRDLHLSWSVQEEAPRPTVLLSREEGEGKLAFTLLPGSRAAGGGPPRELVFVVDGSGSMNGEPYAVAQELLVAALASMRPQDRFNIVRFSDRAEVLSEAGLVPGEESLTRALAFLSPRQGGGTRLEIALDVAYALRPPPGTTRVLVVITDGQVGYESGIFQLIAEHASQARVMALGVGASPNRYLIEGIAVAGRGVASLRPLGPAGEDTVAELLESVAHPQMIDLHLNFDGMEIFDQVPEELPDLWPGEPVRVVARYEGQGTHRVTLEGIIDGEPVELVTEVDLDAAGPDEAISTLWALQAIRHLSRELGMPASLREDRMAQIALHHHLLGPTSKLVVADVGPRSCSPGEGEVAAPMQPLGLVGAAARIAYRPPLDLFPAGYATQRLEAGALSREVIDTTIKARLPAISAPYLRALRRNPGLEGLVTVQLTIEADGHVSEASIEGSTLGDAKIEGRLLELLRETTFPAPRGGGRVIVRYPIRFSPPVLRGQDLIYNHLHPAPATGANHEPERRGKKEIE